MKGAWRAEDEGLGGNVGENTTGTACTNVTDKDLDRPSGVPNELLGVPLVDFDLPGDENHVEDNNRVTVLVEKTFVVIARRFGKQIVYRFNKEKSLYLFPPESSLRQFVIFITTNQYFEVFILLLIISNCVVLAFNNLPEQIEYVFSALYTMEMTLKILGKGFCKHRFAYLRDPWNWMDFVVVILGYLTLFPSVANLSGIRTFRVLRALRTISVVEGLKTMVNAFLKSMRMLTDVLLLAMFFISVFALIGMQLFVGVLRNKCVLNPDDGIADLDYYLANESNWLFVDEKPLVCGNSSTARSCPKNYTCFPNVGDNPNHGYTSFDTFPWAVVSTIQLVTADYWENIYGLVIASSGFWSLFYFLLVIFFGSFYILNLILAVVTLSYQQEMANFKSRSTARDIARKSSSSYSLHVSIRPQKLFETTTVSPMSNWSSVVDRLTKTYYSNNPRVSPGTYLTSTSNPRNMNSPRQSTIPCTIIVEELEPSSSNDVNVQSFDEWEDNSVVGNEAISNPKEGIIVARKESLNSKSVSRLGPAGFEKFLLASRSRLSVGHGGMFVKTSSLCVIIPPERNERGNRSLVNVARRKCARVIMNPTFDWFITAVIFINTIFMALEYHGMDTRLERVLDTVNLVCTFVFMFEMFLKVTALSPRGYVRSRWNILDGCIVLISIVELGIVNYVPDVTHVTGISVLRSLRLARVLKLAQSWETMRTLLSTISGSIGPLGNLTLLLAIVIYTFAVIGMQLFSDRFTPEKFPHNEVPRWNFSDFLHSFMMIFRVLCGEWIEPLVLTMHATSPAAILFYFPVLILGNFLILNLFIALLLNSFATGSLTPSNEHPNTVTENFYRLVGTVKKVLRAFRSMSVSAQMTKLNLVGDSGGQLDTKRDTEETKRLSRISKTSSQEKLDKQGTQIPDGFSSVSRSLEGGDGAWSKMKRDHSVMAIVKHSRHETQDQIRESDVAECFPSFCRCGNKSGHGGQSLVHSRYMAARSKVLKVVKHNLFDGFILTVIIVSSIALAFEDIHLNSKPTLKWFLEIVNYVADGIFAFEFIFRVFGLGFDQYFRDAWNCLDFMILVVSMLNLVGSVGGGNHNLIAFRSLRTLRALRPLRAIPRWQGMKVVVNSLLFAIPEIGNVALVCSIFWLVFSVMGVQFFGGKFFKCVDENGEILPDSLVPNKTSCLSLNYKWKNSDINFDNALAGFLALFQVATFEGWIEIMEDAGDVTKVDEQPKRENNAILLLYFVVFVLIGSFFALNLFVGVTIDNFNRLKKQYEGHGAIGLFLTDAQRTWYDTLRKASGKKPRKVFQKPKGKWRGRMFDVINSSRFEIAIMLLILANMIVMTIQHYGQSETITETLDPRFLSWQTLYCNVFFTIIFLLEAILRLCVLRLDYFKQPWNDFDFIVVILSLVGVVLEYIHYNFVVTPSIFRVIRVFRMGRLLRFYKNARGIRRLLVALFISLPALTNVGGLLFLILFIYAIVGMFSFAYVKQTGAINDMVNFETFGNSMLLLFRLSTSAGWNDVLGGLMIEPPDCDPKYDDLPNGNCGSPYFAIFYFVSFILIISLIVVNMYIAVILENLNEAFQEEAAGINVEDLDMFYSKWEHFDPLATQYIPHDQLSQFVDSLEGPLRIPKPNKFACIHLNIPIQQGDRIHCVDVLQALVRHALGDIDKGNPEVLSLIQKKLEERFVLAFPTRARQQKESTTFERNREIRAAIVIQKAWRAKWRNSASLHAIGQRAL